MEILSNASLGHGRWHRLLHLVFILYAMFICLCGIRIALPSEGWVSEMSEMFDNYAGGFVRRGLFGSVLLWLHGATGIHPYCFIIATVLLSYAVLAWYFVRQFRRRGFCWYFLVTCLMLGSFGVYGAMMRRMFLVVLFLAVVQLLKRALPWVALVLGNALAIVGLLCYEPFFFFSVPMFIVLTHALGGSWKRATAVWLPSIAVFLMVSVCHGDPVQFEVMKDAASPYIGANPYMLNFIQWGIKDIVSMHLSLNYFSMPWYVPSILVNVLALAYVLFIGTNGVMAFEQPSEATHRQSRTLFGLVAFQLATQLPMFLILSTDYGRICCFSVMTAYITYFTFGDETLRRMFPEKVSARLDGLCDRMNRAVVPTRSLVVGLFLFVGVSAWQGHIGRMAEASMVGKTMSAGYKALKVIKQHIQP